MTENMEKIKGENRQFICCSAQCFPGKGINVAKSFPDTMPDVLSTLVISLIFIQSISGIKHWTSFKNFNNPHDSPEQ